MNACLRCFYWIGTRANALDVAEGSKHLGEKRGSIFSDHRTARRYYFLCNLADADTRTCPAGSHCRKFGDKSS
jgi:hypothetical protein